MFLKLTESKQTILLNSDDLISVWPDGSYPGALLVIRGEELCTKVEESPEEIYAQLRGGDA